MWPEPDWPDPRRPMCAAPPGDAICPPGWIPPLVPRRGRFSDDYRNDSGVGDDGGCLDAPLRLVLYTKALVGTAATIARAGFASQQAGGTRA